VLRHQPAVMVTTDAVGAPVLGASRRLTMNMSDYDYPRPRHYHLSYDVNSL